VVSSGRGGARRGRRRPGDAGPWLSLTVRIGGTVRRPGDAGPRPAGAAPGRDRDRCEVPEAGAQAGEVLAKKPFN